MRRDARAGGGERRPTTRPTRRRRPDLREHLLECTTAIIKRHGLAFVSLRAVARRARVSHGAPAYHFRSKAGLLTAYAEQGYRRLSAAVARATERAGVDPARRLVAVGRAYVAFAVANPEHFTIMFRGELHDRGDEGLRREADRALGMLRDAIAACVAGGLLRTPDPEAALAASWSVAHGLAVLWVQGRMPRRVAEQDADAFAERVLSLYVAALLQGPTG
jgi:AcrR family transcriptional regulator